MDGKSIPLCIIVFCLSLIGCGSPQSNSNSINNNGASSPTLPAPISSSPTVTGSSTQEDAVGDVRDGNYRKPKQKLSGIDLVSVKIESAGADLKVTFTANTDFPGSRPPNQSAIWDISACTPDRNRCCTFGSKVVEAEWLAYIFDMRTTRNTYVNVPLIRGKELIMILPYDKLPEWMRRPFKWWATSEWGGTWKDRIPDEGKDILNIPTVPFPKT